MTAGGRLLQVRSAPSQNSTPAPHQFGWLAEGAEFKAGRDQRARRARRGSGLGAPDGQLQLLASPVRGFLWGVLSVGWVGALAVDGQGFDIVAVGGVGLGLWDVGMLACCLAGCQYHRNVWLPWPIM